MSILVVGDFHIDKDSIDEMANICDEIRTYKADKLVQLGDYFDKSRPSPQEIDFGAYQAKKFKECYEKVFILSGNHDTIDNKVTSIDYLRHLDIEIKQYALELYGIYFGHFLVDKSPLAQYGYQENLSNLFSQNSLVILGHYHDFIEIDNNAYHLGAVRYVNFGETTQRQIAIIESDIKTHKVRFLPLKSSIPMVTVDKITDLETINRRTKVRLIINSYEELLKATPKIKEWKEKFHTFKIKPNFSPVVTKINDERKLESTKAIIDSWLDDIEDAEVGELLAEYFKEKKLV